MSKNSNQVTEVERQTARLAQAQAAVATYRAQLQAATTDKARSLAQYGLNLHSATVRAASARLAA